MTGNGGGALTAAGAGTDGGGAKPGGGANTGGALTTGDASTPGGGAIGDGTLGLSLNFPASAADETGDTVGGADGGTVAFEWVVSATTTGGVSELGGLTKSGGDGATTTGFAIASGCGAGINESGAA